MIYKSVQNLISTRIKAVEMIKQAAQKVVPLKGGSYASKCDVDDRKLI